MDEIGDIIRKVLFFREQSLTDFAKSIGLPLSSIENVIYKKIRKKEILDKISKGLGVDLIEYINLKNSSPTSNISDLNFELYKKAVDVVNLTIQNKNIMCTKVEKETLTEILYKFLLENEEVSDIAAEIFCQGMIEYALRHFIVTKELK